MTTINGRITRATEARWALRQASTRGETSDEGLAELRKDYHAALEYLHLALAPEIRGMAHGVAAMMHEARQLDGAGHSARELPSGSEVRCKLYMDQFVFSYMGEIIDYSRASELLRDRT